MTRPIAIDLFSGAGGMSLGFEQAGFDIAAAVDVDPIHACVHKFNFPTCTVIPKSVSELTGSDIRRAAGIGNKRVHVVIGGAPCQGFSLIGQRALDDPRNSLVRDFVRVVKELKASYFVFENVKGLTVGKHRVLLEEIIEEFNSIGYRVQTPWQVLQAAQYGVPQNRERLILIGAKKNYRLPEYPVPRTRSAGTDPMLLDLPEGPTCRDALGDLPEPERFSKLEQYDFVKTSQWGKPSKYAHELRCVDRESWHYSFQRKWDPMILTSSARTNHTEISRKRFAETEEGQVEPISRFYKLPSGGISNTLRAGTDSARGAFTSPRPIHYKTPRCITVREMARLHGFPDWFRFHVTKWHGARQVGNAVAPPLARALGAEILRALDVIPQKPRQKIELGDPLLLEMDMTEAAEYWNVPIAIGKRNRKSGAKKRKQSEIEQLRIAGISENAYG
ncbi:DNA cytosine methyltransferase [Thiohalophilus sp.]|uniref:DNA cytosine methyltransferase n=1 Tax=Thiohalophilus sp. TaxID=3028392 RepID=UPI002ACE10AD|nr:DNA cytosine methyltransferase [Thiohalophilus sp.]MDZ7661649.1 DNA cytosine methyltransferase [Thiohalophilus sp.]